MNPSDNNLADHDCSEPVKAPLTWIQIQTSDFYDSIQRYIDETKPDPSLRKQFDSWQFDWISSPDYQVVDDEAEITAEISVALVAGTVAATDTGTTGPRLDTRMSPHSGIGGTLSIFVNQHQFISLALDVLCVWNDHFLVFKIHPRVLLLSLSEKVVPTKGTTSPTTLSRRQHGPHEAYNDKTSDQIPRTELKLWNRYQNDDYVKKLLDPWDRGQLRKRTDIDTVIPLAPLLCEARIYITEDATEERVLCEETTIEGVRRVVLSSSESSSLDVLEAILYLPFLPENYTKLASRAKLRLLEEAMCNACEQEGEDELVSDLDIDSVDENEDKQPRKKGRKSAPV